MIILVIEDEPSIAELWKRHLAPVTREIRFANNLVDGLKLMATRPNPNLVVLDLKLPGSTPENTLCHIADLKEHNPNAIVLVVTGMYNDKLPTLASQLGADDYQSKREMVSQSALLKAIKSCFEKQKEQGRSDLEASSYILERLNNTINSQI